MCISHLSCVSQPLPFFENFDYFKTHFKTINNDCSKVPQLVRLAFIAKKYLQTNLLLSNTNSDYLK